MQGSECMRGADDALDPTSYALHSTPCFVHPTSSWSRAESPRGGNAGLGVQQPKARVCTNTVHTQMLLALPHVYAYTCIHG